MGNSGCNQYTDATWMYLSVDEIRTLSRINKRLMKIRNNPETWAYLLKRDYNIDTFSGNPEIVYERIELYNKLRPNIVPYIESKIIVPAVRYGKVDPYDKYSWLAFQIQLEDVTNALFGTDPNATYLHPERNETLDAARKAFSELNSKYENKQIVFDKYLDVLTRLVVERELPM